MSPKQRLIAAVGATAAALLLALVPAQEGTKLQAYRDPVGIPTICSGDTQGVKLGDVSTQAQCDDRTAARIAEHYDDIRPCIHVPLTPGQTAAFTSFAYNVGATQFCNSTMARKLNTGDIAGACAELSKWVKAGGKTLAGLVKRRAEERRLCETQ